MLLSREVGVLACVKSDVFYSRSRGHNSVTQSHMVQVFGPLEESSKGLKSTASQTKTYTKRQKAVAMRDDQGFYNEGQLVHGV